MTNKEAYRLWESEQIRSATRYSACMFVGLGNGPNGRPFDTRFSATLGGAREHAQVLHKQYLGQNFRRSVMLYAITQSGITIHLGNVPAPTR